jgi:hypothetical protein|tara:strand:- start:181 stop:456 length:276 start_codon:yes stop_codon:yes gene_type:complete
MKMTIVIDTTDPDGIEDAHKIVSIMRAKHSYAPHSSTSVTFQGKIEFIKMLRRFGNEAIDQYKNEETFKLESIASLRFTKSFADRVWIDKG